MQIYSHKQSTPNSNMGFLVQLALVITALISLSVVSQAHETTHVYVNDMSEFFPDDANVMDVLLLCEHFDGIYKEDGDVCITFDRPILIASGN